MKWCEGECKKCGTLFSLPKHQVGGTVKCPTCNTWLMCNSNSNNDYGVETNNFFIKKKKKKGGGGYINGGPIKNCRR